MNQSTIKTFIVFLFSIILLYKPGELKAQSTSVVMTIEQVVQISPSIFEYNVMLTNTGTTALALRGYSCGLNHAPGMNGGGNITHTFISRDPSLSSIPAISATYTASVNQIRLTTVNAAAGFEVPLTAGVPIRLATMRVTNSVNYPVDFEPQFTAQTTPAIGKTQCIAACIVTPPGTSFALNGAGNTPNTGTLQVLTAQINSSCLYLNPSAVFSATVSSNTPVTCFGQNTGSLEITMNGAGSGNSGTYSLNGGPTLSFNSNPFAISGLSAGNYTVDVSNPNGCSASAQATITQPSSGITGNSSLAVCDSYTWNGTTYTASGIYSQTFTAASGCDSIHSLNLTINNASTGISAVSSCDSYTWNGTTYTASGNLTQTYTNAAGCDSVHTIQLTINGSSGSSIANVCDSYVWNGTTYTNSGIYQFTFNGTACDSVHTLNLTIRNSTSSSTSNVVTTSYTWPINNVTYTNTGVYTHSLLNAAGCDSVLYLNLTVLNQSATILMRIQNAIQTAPNVFEYDLVLVNTGSLALALRGYSAGITHATSMRNGGTLTHTFVSRDPILSTIPAVSANYTASVNHMRLTTVNASSGNEVVLPPGVPIRIATMRASNSVNYPADFNPAFTMQIIPQSQRTQCIATCIVTPPGTSYALNGAGNAPTASSLQTLSTVVNTPCFFLSPSVLFTGNITSNTTVLCFGQNNGAVEITLSGTGSAAPAGSTGTYRVNNGAAVAYSSNPFMVSNLAAGTHTISVTTSGGCTKDIVTTIIQPSGPITGNSALSACNSYTWNGTTYTASASPQFTYIAANGCDSVHTLNLTINQSNTGSSSQTACDKFTWNGVTYTASANPVFTFLNSANCDSVHTLNLQINYSSSASFNAIAGDTYLWTLNGTTYTNSGSYTHTISNALGCDSVLTLNLTILNFTLNTDQDISCYGNNDGTLLASASGGSGNFVYDLDGANLWNNVTGYFFNITPGNHTVCAREQVSNFVLCATTTVLEPAPLTAVFTVDSAVTCNGSNGMLSIAINGGTAIQQPYLTLWTNSNGDTLNDQTNNNFATTLGNLPAGNYFVRVEDDRACVINVDTTLIAGPCEDTLKLKLFIQGFYSGSSAMSPVLLNQGVSSDPTLTDSITIELRDATALYNVVDSKTAALLTNGNATALFSNLDSSYYIVVKHRNGLQTWSAAPVSFGGNSVMYDFSTAASMAYGNNMIEVDPSIWAIYSGDINSDENIDLLDASLLEADIAFFLFGYYATDINGDGNVDLLDSPIVETNINSFIYSLHP